MSIKEMLEQEGIENPDAIVESIEKEISTKLQEMKDQQDVELAKKVTKIQEAAEEKAQAELAEHKELLHQWHVDVINKQLEENDNSLKIAAEIKSVRKGFEKILEGMKEAGINTTQVFENIAAAEVVGLQDQIKSLKEDIDALEYKNTALQRAFVVSEATRNMADVDRDSIINSAEALDESLTIDRFASLVGLLIKDKSLDESIKDKETKLDESVNLDTHKSLADEVFNDRFTARQKPKSDNVDWSFVFRG